MSSILGVFAKGTCDFDFEGLCCIMNGIQVNCLTIKLRLEKDLYLNNSLIYMYAKSGEMNGAKKVLALFFLF